jgi:eukaryotic-like serine/threonine-protein kinase
MSLTRGSKLGPYEILAPIGAGGMGEVYQANDTKLDRKVAIKVLPTAVSHDPERLARFEREAKVLAALNHPNIAHIYGLEESGSTRALVMELVDGSTLSVPQPLETALDYARQIAEALEAAHERGVTHRDLKPANIMVTPNGVVKVLDFGLASVPSREATGDPSTSPTMTMAATQAGMIMGTASYMSPEQAAGKVVDKRSDIWSFGVVLYEMLSGAKLFEGETVSHTLADVLRAPIGFDKLPASTPPYVVQLLKRCLTRDPKKRLRDIGDARIVLEEPPPVELAPATAIRSRFALLPWIATGAFALLAGALGVVAYRHTGESPPQVIMASLMPPERAGFAFNGPAALSPDGTKLAFVADQGSRLTLWVRDLDSLALRSIAGTDNARGPFWSPDSQSVAFYADGKLKRVSAAGGPILTLCSTEGNSYGGSWSSVGVILFPISPTGPLHRVSSSGGPSTPLTKLDSNAGEVSHRFPWFLPDGRHFLYTSRNRDRTKAAVFVGDLESGTRTTLLNGEFHAEYASSTGFLVFAHNSPDASPLMAQAMDPSTFQTKGEPFPIVERVDRIPAVWTQHHFTVSQNGLLAYSAQNSNNPAQLTWVDRSGKALGVVPMPDGLWVRSAKISPNGTTLAFDAGKDIWLHDLARGTSSRFTLNPTESRRSINPSWSPDGREVIFSDIDGPTPPTLVKKALATGGAVEPVGPVWGDSKSAAISPVWSQDGRYIVAAINRGLGGDIWMLPLQPAGQKPRPYLENVETGANESNPALSPSSEWLAYASDETGQREIYVQSFPTPGRKYQISVSGGFAPVWSRDGKELFYVAPDRQLMAVAIQSRNGNLERGAPKALFDSKLIRGLDRTFDVSKDGRFLIPMDERTSAPPLTLVVNWQAGLKK